MTVPTGNGLKLRLELRRLAVRHRVTLEAPPALPLLLPAEGLQVVCGLASTPDTDRDRTRFAPFAFGILRTPYPPILVKHDPGRVAGRIDRLEYDARGGLKIWATVDGEARRLPAFSVGARVLEYQIRDADARYGFHAVVTDAVLDEISLTDRPFNPNAVVTGRHLAPPDFAPARQFHSLLAQKVDCMARTLAVLRQMSAAQAAAGRSQPQPSPPSRPAPRRRSSFSQLVEQLEQRQQQQGA